MDSLYIHWVRALAQTGRFFLKKNRKVHIPWELFQQEGEGWVGKISIRQSRKRARERIRNYRAVLIQYSIVTRACLNLNFN